MLVRAAEAADVSAVAALNATVQQLHYEARPDWFVAPDAEAIASWLTATLGRDDVFVFVAEEDERILGYAVATLRRRAPTPFTRSLVILEMDQIGVDAEVRRSGVGSLLLRRIADLRSEVGGDLAMLTVWDFNEVARASFRSRGFVDAMHRLEFAPSI
jgi:GNAT superfamily N-acetyltransferase